MQPTFSSSRILLPVRPWFIYLSLVGALLLNFLPTAHWPGMPDWVALVLCFWSVREFRRVGMGWGFVLGLLMDVADGAVLGQHCFAYVLLAYAAASLSRRLLWFPLAQQALHGGAHRIDVVAGDRLDLLARGAQAGFQGVDGVQHVLDRALPVLAAPDHGPRQPQAEGGERGHREDDQGRCHGRSLQERGAAGKPGARPASRRPLRV